MPTNEIRNLYYFPPKWEEYYDRGLAEDIRKVLLDDEYFMPGIIYFEEIINQKNEHQKPGLWMWLPYKTKSPQAFTYYYIDFMPILYMDGKWNFQPLIEE